MRSDNRFLSITLLMLMFTMGILNLFGQKRGFATVVKQAVERVQKEADKDPDTFKDNIQRLEKELGGRKSPVERSVADAMLASAYQEMKWTNITDFDEETRNAIHRQFEQLYLRRDKNFGNAREARRIFDQAVEKQSQRLIAEMNNPDFNSEDMYRITVADLAVGQSEQIRPLDEVLNELDDFIGMLSVKNMIRRLAVQSMFMKQRAAMGAGKVQQMAMNFILTGNPGTGKTSIARKMGEVLQSMEILPTSRVVEASRATLVGKYMGETPKIVNNMCDKAMGGILFIDEAYTLSAENDPYGREAIDALMKRMEDDRGKFVVIAAGYRDEMENFLAVNPGLASRFSHKMHIDDYTADELGEIFIKMASKDNYKLSSEAEYKLMNVIARMVYNKDKNFGNAREMRNLLDTTIQQLSMRVSMMSPSEITQETYQLIMPEDIKE
jgi:SpoVK/Ycf46/Vps4 family AAA+-type ATPase